MWVMISDEEVEVKEGRDVLQMRTDQTSKREETRKIYSRGNEGKGETPHGQRS
jgi:hypothetical protein